MTKMLTLTFLLIISSQIFASEEESPALLAQRVRAILEERFLGMPQQLQRDEIALRLHRPLSKEASIAAQAKQAMNQFRLDDASQNIAAIKSSPVNAEGLEAWFRWLLLTEDYRTLDSMTGRPLDKSNLMAEQLLARAELNYRLLKYADAHALLDSVDREIGPGDARQARRLLILGKILYKQNKIAESLQALLGGFTADGLHDDVLYNTGLTLIRLGRAHDAIALFEEVIEWNPLHEGAHYFLGNGYARLNYSQLADSVDVSLSQAEVLVRKASAAWTIRNFDQTILDCQQAIELVPAYGRAHNCLAKALEGKRMLVSVNRAADEAIFEHATMPNVPGIETYVFNWDSLTSRHQKQVALAVHPWKSYIPLLVECGSRHYIKPLHEKLSECPNLESLKDQRVSYDSRLWDDVRGCGGFTTVTGIEDVERSIYFSYNTVLHELTHQVHGCFPPADLQVLEDAFQAARVLDDGGTPTYMSRYQASSVWEYFAEGANAYYSPKRNNVDTREIVRERLYEMDTVLVRLVEMFMAAPHLEECWPVGLCNAADDAVEKPDLDRALLLAKRAQAKSPHHEVVLSTLCRLHSLRGENEVAMLFADSLVILYPEICRSYLRKAEVIRTASAQSGEERLQILQLALMGTDTSNRVQVFQAIGDLCNYEGRYGEAREAFQWILERQPTDYQAHRGMAIACGNDAKADEHFKSALAERTGIPELRCDYARYLFDVGREDEARKQLDEAILLAPQNGDVLAIMAMNALALRQWSQALDFCEQSLKTASSPRLAAIFKAKALRKSGKQRDAEELILALRRESESAVPQWVYDSLVSNFTTKNEWPVDLKSMLATP